MHRLITTVTLLVGGVSTAHAAIIVQSVTVTHQFSGSQGWGIGTSVPLFNASTGNQFDTWDGRAGASLNIGQSSGSLQVKSWGMPNASLPQPYADPFISALAPRGTIKFTAIDGDFSVSSSPGGSIWHGATYRVTRLQSGEFRQFSLQSIGVTQSGTLTMPAPAGDYELTFVSNQTQMMNNTQPGSTSLTFSITPEPASLTAVLALCMISRRR